MYSTLLAIVWNPDEALFHIGGFALRYYSLLWAIGLILAYLVVQKVYKDMKIPSEKMETLFIYSFFGILIGARLGHCLFYEPQYYLSHPIEMILPIRNTPAGWKLTGYEGLASHGGTIGIIIALWLYVRKTKLNFIDVIDYIGVATPITACCIRLGNLMNGEIVGKVTDVPWAFYFEGYEGARHPAQLYEAIAYLLFFILNIWLYNRYYKKGKLHKGFMFGVTIFAIFLFRFFVEFYKDVQVDFEHGMVLNMGQWLSIPFIILGLAFMIGGKWLDKLYDKLEIKDKKRK